jgi:hypothetical protein
MKSILYVGATLMVGASIYGFISYKKTSKQNEFQNMYSTKKAEDNSSLNNTVGKDASVKNESSKTGVDTKSTDATNNGLIKSSSKVVGSDKQNDQTQDETTMGTVRESKHRSEKETPKSRKLSYKLFSRAPLDEKYIDKELKLEDSKAKSSGKEVQKNN